MKTALILLLITIIMDCAGQSDSSKTYQDCSCETDDTPAGVMISHVHNKGQLMFSYRFMNMQMSGMQSGLMKIDDNQIFEKYLMSSETMRMDMHMLMVMYGLTPRFTIMAMASYTISTMKMVMLPGTHHIHVTDGNNTSNHQMDTRMKTAGFSDLKIQLLYGIIKTDQHQLLGVIGLSVPTGSIQNKGNETSMYPNQRFPYVMQSGSGTWDLIPAISYRFEQGRLTASTQVTSVIRTGYNSVGYKLGNEVTSNTWMSFRWFKSVGTSLRAEASLQEQIKGRDKSLYSFNEPSARPYNYGGQRVIGFVGMSYSFNKGILQKNKLGIEYGTSLFQNINGPQMRVTSVLNASWSYTL